MKKTIWAISAACKSVGLLILFSSLMLLIRIIHTDSVGYVFLWWNLFLALLPVGAAYLFDSYVRKRGLYSLLSFFFLINWLLFFPNAPYLITDLIHLADDVSGVPLWYDALMLFSFAFTGVFSGFLSLVYVYRALKGAVRSSRLILFVPGICMLSGYGIYLGRELRWNSWDMFTRPHMVAGDIYSNISDPAAWSMTVLFSVFLFLLWYIMSFFFNSENAR